MCLCLGLALVVYLVVCYDFVFDGVSRRVCPKGDFVCPSGTGCGCIVLVFNRLWLTCVPEGSKYLPFRNVFNPGRHSSPTHLIDKFDMMPIAIFHADYSHFSVLIITCKTVHRCGEGVYGVLNPPSQEQSVPVSGILTRPSP